MKRFLITTAAVIALVGAGATRRGRAQPGHNNWHPGGRIAHATTGATASRSTTAPSHFRSARRAATNAREVNGQYVLAAVATGIIASIILANH